MVVMQVMGDLHLEPGEMDLFEKSRDQVVHQVGPTADVTKQTKTDPASVDDDLTACCSASFYGFIPPRRCHGRRVIVPQSMNYNIGLSKFGTVHVSHTNDLKR